MMGKKEMVLFLVIAAGLTLGSTQAATTLDVYESSDLSTPIGQIQSIATAQTGAQHYDYFSASGHPTGVNLGPYNSNIWIHENTATGEYTFGFIFSQDNGGVENTALLLFRVVDSDSDVYVAQSDDAGEATEPTPGAFEGDYWYSNNTDGIAVSGITGSNWTVIVDSVDFGNITDWYAANGGGDDIALDLGGEYRITLEGNPPSGAPVSGDILAVDIKPGSCPNPLNVKSQGVLPAAILGTDTLDVTTIDPASVRLAGVEPLRWAIEDVATPMADSAEDCECTTEGPDGYDDLTLKFDTQAIVAALGDVEDGAELELTLTGALYDGTPIEGSDCIRVIKKGKD
jgi:hypothetical protein